MLPPKKNVFKVYKIIYYFSILKKFMVFSTSQLLLTQLILKL